MFHEIVFAKNETDPERKEPLENFFRSYLRQKDCGGVSPEFVMETYFLAARKAITIDKLAFPLVEAYVPKSLFGGFTRHRAKPEHRIQQKKVAKMVDGVAPGGKEHDEVNHRSGAAVRCWRSVDGFSGREGPEIVLPLAGEEPSPSRESPLPS